MKRPITLLAAAWLLAGCATAPTPHVQLVKVPVAVPCNTPEISKPVMYFDNEARPEMSLYQKLQLLLAQDYNLKGYATELEAAVDACRSKP